MVVGVFKHLIPCKHWWLNDLILSLLPRLREVFCLDYGPKTQFYHLHMSQMEAGIQRGPELVSPILFISRGLFKTTNM